MTLRRRACLAAAGLAFLLSGCNSASLSSSRPVLSTSETSSSPAATATPQPTPFPTTPDPYAAQPLSAAIAAPEAITFLSPSHGFVLGLTLCGAVPCLRLAQTTDAGMSWSWVTNADLSHISAAVPWQMRFADESDGWISGYVESPHLYSTHDGGHTWREVHLPGTGTKLGGIGSLEATSGWVYAEVATGAEPNTGGPAELYRSEVSRDAWQPVPGVMTPVAGEPGSLSIADGAIWATFHPMTVEQGGGLRTGSTLFRSLDGISWRSVPLPCAEATVADGAALGREEAIVTCSGGSAAGSQKKTAFRTQDAGATFVAIADPPFTGHIWSVGGAPGTLALGMVAAETTIDVSRDDGQSWTVVFDRPDGGEGISFLGFTTPRLAEAIVGGIFPPSTLALVMSRDGGSHWSVVTIHPS